MFQGICFCSELVPNRWMKFRSGGQEYSSNMMKSSEVRFYRWYEYSKQRKMKDLDIKWSSIMKVCSPTFKHFMIDDHPSHFALHFLLLSDHKKETNIQSLYKYCIGKMQLRKWRQKMTGKRCKTHFEFGSESWNRIWKGIEKWDGMFTIIKNKKWTWRK